MNDPFEIHVNFLIFGLFKIKVGVFWSSVVPNPVIFHKKYKIKKLINIKMKNKNKIKMKMK